MVDSSFESGLGSSSAYLRVISMSFGSVRSVVDLARMRFYLGHQRLIAAVALESVDGKGGMNADGAHQYVLPVAEASTSGLLAPLDALLKVVDGGGAGVVVPEVPNKLCSNLVPRFDVVLGEGVEPPLGTIIHQ
jgi:hypothetical protein